MQDSSKRSTLLLGLGTLISRILGFARDILLAFLLGPGADVFLIAFRIPNFFRRLLAEGSFGIAHGAAFTRESTIGGVRKAIHLTREIQRSLFFIILPLIVCLFLFSDPLAFLLAPGLKIKPDDLNRAAFLIQCTLPYLPFCCLAAIRLATCISLGSSGPQAFAPAAFNLCLLMAGGIALYNRMTPTDVELVLCVGICVAGVVQWLMAVAGEARVRRKAGFRMRLGTRWRRFLVKSRRIFYGFPLPALSIRQSLSAFAGWLFPPNARAVLARIPAGTIGGATHQLLLISGMIVASFHVGGSITALYLAERLCELPLGLAGVTIGMAAVPRLAAFLAQDNIKEFNTTLADNLSLTAFLSFPAAAGLAGLCLPITELMFERGAYGNEEVLTTAACLAAYAPGLPAMCAARPLLAALAATGETKIQIFAALQSIALAVAVSILFKSLGAPGIALGISAGAWLNFILLLRGLTGKGYANPLLAKFRPMVLYACLACLLVSILHVLPIPEEDLFAIGLLTLVICGCAFLWIFAFWASGNEDAHNFVNLFRRQTQ